MKLSVMAEKDILLEEEEDENKLLLDFYEENKIFLRKIQLYQVPHRLKYKMAIKLQLVHGNIDWKICLEDLGLDHDTIAEIDFKASQSKPDALPPFYCALEGPLQARLKSFGEVMEVLIRAKKFHILKYAKPFIKGLIEQQVGSTGESSDCEPSAPLDQDFTLDECLEVVNQFDMKKSTEDYLRTDETYPLNSHSGHLDCGNKYNLRSHEKFQKCDKVSLQKQFVDVPKAVNVEPPIPRQDEAISVFVLHAMTDNRWAYRLESFLKRHNFKVITSASISDYLRMNPTKILKAINSKVDFIIPILSEVFMNQIQPTMEPNNILTTANYFMYDLVQNEYLCRGFQNYRVRAVSVPNQRIQVHNDSILSWYFRLWDETPNLIQNLKITKKKFL